MVWQLYKGDPTRKRQDLQIMTPPGIIVIFNGDKLWHAVTPLEPGAERIMLTMEYVTNPKMGTIKRSVSNMKDAIAYFGVSALWRGRPSARRHQATAGIYRFLGGGEGSVTQPSAHSVQKTTEYGAHEHQQSVIMPVRQQQPKALGPVRARGLPANNGPTGLVAGLHG